MVEAEKGIFLLISSDVTPFSGRVSLARAGEVECQDLEHTSGEECGTNAGEDGGLGGFKSGLVSVVVDDDVFSF